MNSSRTSFARRLGQIAIAMGAGFVLFGTQLVGAEEITSQALPGGDSSASSIPSRPFESQPSHRIQLAAGLHHFDYREEVPQPRKSTETGVLPSVVLGYRYDVGPSKPLFFARLEGATSVSTNYDGTDQSGRHPITGSTLNRFLELEADLATPALSFESVFQARVYAGAGYHYWRRGDQADGSGAYREDYQWPLAIAGALFQSSPTDRLGIDLDFSARWQMLGSMKVFLSEIDGGLQDASVRLGDRLGFKAQLPVSYRIYRTTSLLFSPWLELSSIGESAPVAVRSSDGSETGRMLSEPSSRTVQYGSLLGVSFSL